MVVGEVELLGGPEGGLGLLVHLPDLSQRAAALSVGGRAEAGTQPERALSQPFKVPAVAEFESFQVALRTRGLFQRATVEQFEESLFEGNSHLCAG